MARDETPALGPVTDRDGGATIVVRAKPRSAKDSIGGLRAGALEVSVRAVPEGGRANAAIEALLADRLGVPKRDVTVVRGATARTKHLAITGRTAAQVREALGLLDLPTD